MIHTASDVETETIECFGLATCVTCGEGALMEVYDSEDNPRLQCDECGVVTATLSVVAEEFRRGLTEMVEEEEMGGLAEMSDRDFYKLLEGREMINGLNIIGDIGEPTTQDVERLLEELTPEDVQVRRVLFYAQEVGANLIAYSPVLLLIALVLFF